jgi:hypothetical protein
MLKDKDQTPVHLQFCNLFMKFLQFLLFLFYLVHYNIKEHPFLMGLFFGNLQLAYHLLFIQN